MLTKSDFPQSMSVDALAADLMIAQGEGRGRMIDKEYTRLIEVVPTSSDSKLETFFGEKGRFRRFRGERQPQIFYEYKSLLMLDDWEYTETVKRQVLDDDQTGGALRNRIGDFGYAAEVDLKRRTEEHLRRGTSYKCFDTNMFFSQNHVYTDTKGATHGTKWSNFFVGGSQVSPTTIQLTAQHFANIKTDRDTMWMGRLTDVGVRRGTANEVTAREIANSQYTVDVSTVKGSNTTNVWRGSFGIITFDHGIGHSEWYGFDLSGSEKPIKVLNHTVSPGWDNLEYTQLLQNSETGFWRNEFVFGYFGRFDWNPGDPRTACLYGTTTWTDPDDADLERRRVLEPNQW